MWTVISNRVWKDTHVIRLIGKEIVRHVVFPIVHFYHNYQKYYGQTPHILLHFVEIVHPGHIYFQSFWNIWHNMLSALYILT